MSNDIILRPQNMTELQQFATMVAKTDMIPKDFKGKPETIVVAVMMGHELGLPPLAALQNIAVINGRPSVWGDALLAIVQSSGQLEDINEVYDDETKTAHCHVIRKGRTPQSRSFSLQDAKNAKLLGKPGPWTQYPQRMLQLRARAFALRDMFADLLRGVSMAEEAQDMAAAEVDVTPHTAAKAALGSSQTAKAKAALAGPAAVAPQDEAETAVVGEHAGDSVPDASYDSIIETIRSATTVDDLTVLAQSIGEANLSMAEMKKLREEWVVSKKKLEAAA